MKGASLYQVTHLERVVCALRKQDRTGPWIASPIMPRNILTIIYMTSLIFVHLRIMLVCTPSCGKHSNMHTWTTFGAGDCEGIKKRPLPGGTDLVLNIPWFFVPEQSAPIYFMLNYVCHTRYVSHRNT
jgi:hypothetical protein